MDGWKDKTYEKKQMDGWMAKKIWIVRWEKMKNRWMVGWI